MTELEKAMERMSALHQNLTKSAEVKAAAVIPTEMMPQQAAPAAPPQDPSAQPGLLDAQPAAPQEAPISRAEIQQLVQQAMQAMPAPGAAPGAPGAPGAGGKGGAKQQQEERLARIEVALSQVLKQLGLASPEEAVQEGLKEHAQQAEAQLPPPGPDPSQAPAPATQPFGPGGGAASGIPAPQPKMAAVSGASLARRIRGR